jgi:hypothetical protein
MFTMLTTNQKGGIAETAIAHEAIKLGIGVLRPLQDLRYDLVFDTGDELLRVQCKWGAKCGDVIVIRLYGARRARSGLVRSFYGPGEVDAFAAYCADTGRCYFARITEVAGRCQLQLRIGATRNNQRSGVNWARDYEFAAKLSALPGP